MTDARRIFDTYIVRYSTVRELVEVLQYTHLFGSQCLGRVLKELREITNNGY